MLSAPLILTTTCSVLNRTQVLGMVARLGSKLGFFLSCCFRGWKKGAGLWWKTRKDEGREMETA